MSIEQFLYETLLCEYSHRQGAIDLLKKHRAYLEMIPSLRRPEKSLITIPLPLIRVRHSQPTREKNLSTSPTEIVTHHNLFSWQETVQLPCDLAILMCDPNWQIKIGSEILVFIHRPQEDFSHLLSRWRSCQIYLDQQYEWLMPLGEEHIFSESAEQIYPLFVVFEKSLSRIKQGLTGANLPFVVEIEQSLSSDEPSEIISEK